MFGTAKPNTMLIEDQHPELAHQQPARRSTGWWTRFGGKQQPEQAEDRARRADRRLSPPKTKLATDPPAAQTR